MIKIILAIFISIVCMSAQAYPPQQATVTTKFNTSNNVRISWSTVQGFPAASWKLFDNGIAICSGSLTPYYMYQANYPVPVAYPQSGGCSRDFFAGSHLLSVSLCYGATCTSSATTSIYIQNHVPILYLSAVNNSYYEEDIVRFNASAFDQDGQIRYVNFFVDGQQIGRDATPSFSASWRAVEGNHTVMAYAVDNLGRQSKYSYFTFTVAAKINSKPVVAIQSTHSSAVEGDVVELSVVADDADGSVREVRYYVDGVWIDTVKAPPFSSSWAAISGNHAIEAVAIDNTGEMSLPAAVNIVVTGEAQWVPSSLISSYTYDPDNGLIDKVYLPGADSEDAAGFSYDYGYDLRGRRVSITNALGHIVQTLEHSANPFAKPEKIIDSNNVITELKYNNRGLLKYSTLKHPLESSKDATTEYVYDDVGDLTHIIQPSTNYIQYHYDDARRLEKISNSAGDYIRYTLDTAGNRKGEDVFDSSGALHKTLIQEFDELNRLREIIDADTNKSKIGYDLNNNPTLTTDAKLNTAENVYDKLQRVSDIIDADFNPVSITYDDYGQIETVTDQRNLVTTYRYNALGLLRSLSSPDTGLMTFGYDAAGNLTSRRDAKGATTIYKYDALNRLEKEIYPSQPELNKTYGYDSVEDGNYGVGRLTSVTDAGGSIQYIYDYAGRIVNQVNDIQDQLLQHTYGYNADSALEHVCYPGGGCVSYQIDNSPAGKGQVSDIDWQPVSGAAISLATGIEYKPFGPLTDITFGNTLAQSFGYNQNYQLKNYSLSDLLSLTYEYEANGNVDFITNNLSAASSQDFGYDKIDRLTHEVGLYGNRIYGYDDVGNRDSLTLDGKAQAIASKSDSSHLLEKNSLLYSLDANGNTVGNEMDDGSNTVPANYTGTRTFKYNANERLQAVYIDGVIKSSYIYNALGQRVKKLLYSDGVESGSILFSYGQSAQLLSEVSLNADKQVVSRKNIIWLDAMPVAQITEELNPDNASVVSTSIIYLHTDHLNTPRFATGVSGKIVWSWQSDAFGVGAANEDVDGDGKLVSLNLRFPGQYYDAESGLHYNYFRDYDPSLGRYIQSDPIGLDDGPNTYGYVGQNPLSYVDFTGLGKTRVGVAATSSHQAVINSHVRGLINQIQQYNPSYRYSSIGQYSNVGVQQLQGTLFRYQTGQTNMCHFGSSRQGFTPLQNHHGIPHNNSSFQHHKHPLVLTSGVNLRTSPQNQFMLANHSGSHSANYHRQIYQMLTTASRGVTTQQQAIRAVHQVMQRVQQRVTSGSLQPYNSKAVWVP